MPLYPSSWSLVMARGLHVSARRHALTRFAMPAMSPTMSEGSIAEWKKKEGESFQAGDVLVEVETDKATIDVEAQDDGILARIIVPDGTKNIPVGSPIAITAEEGDDLSGVDKMAAESEPAPAESKKSSDSQPSQSEAPSSSESSPPAQESAPEERRPEPSKPQKSEGPSGYIHASPMAKRLALEKGIALSSVKGSGPNGRIIAADLEAAQKAPAGAASAAQVQAYKDTPLSNMRKTIASRLSQSTQTIPHFYLSMDIDMTRTNSLRETFNANLASTDASAKLSVNDFIIKATACALADVPEVNSAWLGESIRQYDNADISVAVATDVGLITPIVKNVGAKGLAAISSEVKSLAKKARNGQLKPEEYQGGTFTISNLGMYGVSHFTAIINPPQACILAIGGTRPTLVAAKDGSHEVRPVMTVTLSSDHRVVDGAVAARWMNAFKSYLENPLTFML